MNTVQKLLACTLLLLAFAYVGCNDDDDNDPQPCNYATELAEELDAVTAAAQAFGANPTTENCEAFRQAYQNYLDEAEQYAECAALAGDQAEYQQAIDQAQQALDGLQC